MSCHTCTRPYGRVNRQVAIFQQSQKVSLGENRRKDILGKVCTYQFRMLIISSRSGSLSPQVIKYMTICFNKIASLLLQLELLIILQCIGWDVVQILTLLNWIWDREREIMIIQQFVQNLFRHLCTRLCHREMYSLSQWLFIHSKIFLTKDLSERAMSNPLVLCLCFFFFSLSSLVKIQLPVGARILSAGVFWENHILLKIFVYDSTQRKKYGWILGCFVFKSTEGLFSEISPFSS